VNDGDKGRQLITVTSEVAERQFTGQKGPVTAYSFHGQMKDSDGAIKSFKFETYSQSIAEVLKKIPLNGSLDVEYVVKIKNANDGNIYTTVRIEQAYIDGQPVRAQGKGGGFGGGSWGGGQRSGESQAARILVDIALGLADKSAEAFMLDEESYTALQLESVKGLNLALKWATGVLAGGTTPATGKEASAAKEPAQGAVQMAHKDQLKMITDLSHQEGVDFKGAMVAAGLQRITKKDDWKTVTYAEAQHLIDVIYGQIGPGLDTN